MTDGYSTWTEEKTDKLRKLYVEGMSFGLIAAELGVSRNAAIGKAQRLGLSGDHAKRAPVQRQKITRPVPAAKSVPTAKPVAALELLPPSGGIRLLDLREHHCKFPIGDPSSAEFRFCGAAKETIIDPYCAAHKAIAYQPRGERRKYDKRLTKQVLRGIAARAL